MTTEHDDTGFEPPHTSSPTDHVLAELQLYGYRPFQDEPDPRPLPEAQAVAGAVADIFDALVVTLGDTRLEPDLEELLWSTVNLFHRAADRIERELDDNEQAQKRSQREQDGSEIRSVELERLTAEGQTLIERRNSMEFFRDQAAEQFERHTHSAWRPRSGSMVNHRTLTSAMIDSRDFLAAKRRAENEVLLPAGPKIAFTGGLDFNDHRLIWDKLDKVHAKHPDMVLLHGGSPKGAERIAARWADHRKVPQQAFARLPMAWSPKKSVLHQTISAIRFETWEAINRALLASAKQNKVESGAAVRIDSTVTAALMHHPSDSALLWDAVRVMTRLLRQAAALPGVPAISWRDRRRLAKKRARAIEYSRGKDSRRQLYRELIAATRATQAALQEAVRGLADLAGIAAERWRARVYHYQPLIERILAQSERRVLDSLAVPAGEKLVSLFEPHADIIVKGAGDVQYGHKLNWPPARAA